MFLLFAVVFLLRRYGTYAVPLSALSTEPSGTFPTYDTPIFARDGSTSPCSGHRTVLDIPWSCLATTFACTWVSVHPNVPWKGEGKWTILGRRIFLMFFSILAPEFMIVWAFKQWRGARMIRETVNRAIKDAYPGIEVHKPKLWSTAHGHFLQMGGFQLSATALENSYNKGSINSGLRNRADLTELMDRDMPHLASTTKEKLGTLLRMGIAGSLCTTQDDELSIKDIHRMKIYNHLSLSSNSIIGDSQVRHETSPKSWTEQVTLKDAEQIDSDSHIWEGVLRSKTLKILLAEGLIQLPTITADEINDRSKGDALSKGLALLQLTWFVVQIITRAFQGLAISKLELTTAALAGMNSVMYLFWWSKPRDVRFPVVVRTKGVERLLASRQVDDVNWEFSDDEFNFRKHLWATVQETVRTARSFFRDILGKLSKGIQAIPQRIREFLSSVAKVLMSHCRKGKSTGLVSPAVPLMADPGTSVEGPDTEEGRHEPPAGKARNTSVSGRLYQLLKLKSIAMSAMKYTTLPVFLLAYVVDLALVIPIAQILGTNEIDSLSDFLGSPLDSESKSDTFQMIFYSEYAQEGPLFVTSSIAGALFGAVHCIAWHFSFPTHVEQIMWRSASVGVVGSCVATLTELILDPILVKMELKIMLTLGLPLLILIWMIPFVYPIARIALLVLAVTSLRSLPTSALDTIDWVELFPHI